MKYWSVDGKLVEDGASETKKEIQTLFLRAKINGK